MRYDELTFFNQQLAGMLKSGIPLESGLRQLCSGMRRGRFRKELEFLETDLSTGVPLTEAISKRQFPEFYRHMIQLGVRSNDLPSVLILVADYYQRASFLWTRLRGLMVYPLIVLLGSLGLSVFLAFFLRSLTLGDLFGAADANTPQISRMLTPVMVWAPLIFLSLATAIVLGFILVPAWRRSMRWRLPGFKEAGLAQLASTIALMLRNGTDLAGALSLARCMEDRTPAGAELALWREKLAQGQAGLRPMAESHALFPPLFFWLIQSAGEDLAAGFERAADIYHARAAHQIEMLLYAALPVSVLFLGAMIVTQAYPVVRSFFEVGNLIDMLGP